MAIAGKLGAVYCQTADASTTFTDEATTSSAGYTRYTITSATKRYWDKTAAVTVKKNGGAITTGYTIEYPGGVVVFDVALAPGDAVTVSGKYLTVSQVGGFFNWSLDANADMAEKTTYVSASWKEFKQTLNGFSGSAEAYWGDETFFNNLGQEMIIVLYVDVGAAKIRFEGYVLFNSDGIEANVSEIVQESIEFEGNGKLYYRTG
jgi:hypothetical protein